MNSVLKERFSASFLFLFGVGLWFYASHSIPSKNKLTTLGPEFFPKFVAVIIILLSAGLILKTFIKRKDENQEEAEQEPEMGRRTWAAVAVFILMFVYITTVEWFGYVITTIVVMSLILWVLLARKWYHYAILIAIVFVIKYVFENIMHVLLP